VELVTAWQFPIMGENDGLFEQERPPLYFDNSGTIPPSYVHSYISPFSSDDESSSSKGFGTIPMLVVTIGGAIVFFLLLLLPFWRKRKSVTRGAGQHPHDDDVSLWDDSLVDEGHGSTSFPMDSQDSVWDDNSLRHSAGGIKPEYIFDSSEIILHLDERGIEMGTA
jgi:hypothetical protein